MTSSPPPQTRTAAEQLAEADELLKRRRRAPEANGELAARDNGKLLYRLTLPCEGWRHRSRR